MYLELCIRLLLYNFTTTYRQTTSSHVAKIEKMTYLYLKLNIPTEKKRIMYKKETKNPGSPLEPNAKRRRVSTFLNVITGYVVG